MPKNPIKSMNISISGHKKEDTLTTLAIDKQIRNELLRLKALLRLQSLDIHIDRYKETGKRVKYSVKAKLMTDRGLFFAHDHAWSLEKAIHGILKKLERELQKYKETHQN